MHYFHVDFRAPDGRILQRFLVIELPPGQSLRSLMDQLYNETQAIDRMDMAIVVRPQVKFQLSNSSIEQVTQGVRNLTSPQLERLAFLTEALSDSRAFARFGGQCFYVLGTEDFGHFISKNINPHADIACSLDSGVVARSELIKAIRDDEIDHLVSTSKAKLPPIGTRVYEAPSGKFVKSFLRVGNIQQSRHALDAIFFWLLPHLRDCVGIITDTWSISSISQNVSRRLVDYVDSDTPCPIEMLADYDAPPDADSLRAADIIERFVTRMADNGRKGIVLVLISATHTGSLQKSLANFLDSRRLAARVKYVSIFRLSDASQIDTLRDYSDVKEFALLDGLSREQQDAAIPIDRSIYFPVRRYDVERVLSLTLLEKNRDFADRYGEISFARVHHTDQSAFPKERHHAVWIDTAKLIRSPAFQRRLKRTVEQLAPAPKLIISPDHPVARDLAGMVAQMVGLPASAVVEHDNLQLDPSVFTDQLLSDKLRECGPAGSLLIIDDAFVTGGRITAYQANLRRTDFKGTMHYLVAISRPQSEREWTLQKGLFERAVAAEAGGATPAPNQFLVVEELLLPNWGQERCPWCIEHEKSARLPTELHRRDDLRAAQGMANNIFLTPGKSDEFALLRGSFFGRADMEQASVFALVSSCLQSLRTVDKDGAARLGQDYFLVSAKIAKAEYLKKYTDEILVASLLRAATVDELVYSDPDADRERTTALTSMFASKGLGIRSEIYFAAVCGKLPSFDLADTSYVAATARRKRRGLSMFDAALKVIGLQRRKRD